MAAQRNDRSPRAVAGVESAWSRLVADLAALDRQLVRLSLHDLLDQGQRRRARRVARAALRQEAAVVLTERTELAVDVVAGVAR